MAMGRMMYVDAMICGVLVLRLGWCMNSLIACLDFHTLQKGRLLLGFSLVGPMWWRWSWWWW